jgi:putative spermidine/putrescine transport system substrate-binding protein
MRRLRIPAIVASGMLLLTACGTQGGASGEASSGPTPLQEVGEGEGELNLVIWTGYAEDGSNDPAFDWVTPFEEETGCEVNTQDGTDSANMVQLMQTGEYDGVSASGDATLRLIAGGEVAPINPDLIPNYANIFEGLKLQPHNSVDGVPYGVPHGRGANVLLYNTEEFAEAPTSWDVVWEADSPAAGAISVYNSAIYIADAALYLMAHNPDLGITNPYELDETQFEAALDLLRQQNEIIGQYWGTAAEQIESFAAGDMLAGTSWQYQANQLTDSPIAATLPEEGSTGWSDTWMISSQAEHPNCMYMWMDHMASPETSAMATVWFGEAPTSEAACEAAEELSPGHCETFHATDEAYFDQIWYWTTPQKDCGDDRGEVCKDFAEWTNAWTEITGS